MSLSLQEFGVNSCGRQFLMRKLLIIGLLIVGLTRAMISIIEWPLDHDSAVWVSYLVIGGVLCAIGALFMARRRSEESV